MPNSANLRLEIEDVKLNQSDSYILFRNSSKIYVVTAGDSGRGGRAHIVIVDEFRIVDLNTITTVLKKFRADRRHPGYLSRPEYKDAPREANKEMYLSSAWYKSHWSFDKAKAFFLAMTRDEQPYFVCGLPYQVSVQEGLLDAQQVLEDMSEGDFNEVSWMIEMEALFYSDIDGTLFQHEDVILNQRLKTAIYPPDVAAKVPSVKLPKIPDLARNERRILSVDVALLASKKHENDASSIWVNSALPNSQGKFVANMIYSENFEGLHTSDLALRVRRMYEQYHCTDIALDVRGVGVGVYDALCRDIYDPMLGVTYPPLSCCNDPVYAERCVDPTAPKVIWAIQATSQFNNDMYLSLREGFKQRRINLLISAYDYKEQMADVKAFVTMDPMDRVNLMRPYMDADLLINELVNLECEAKGTVIKVSERAGMRKDRVSSVGYNYYVMQQIERKYKTAAQDLNWNNYVSVRAPQLKKKTRRW